jgi:hypothetical protein
VTAVLNSYPLSAKEKAVCGISTVKHESRILPNPAAGIVVEGTSAGETSVGVHRRHHCAVSAGGGDPWETDGQLFVGIITPGK